MKKRFLSLLLAIMAICPLIVACSDEYYQYDSYKQFIELGDPSKIEITEADIEYGILGIYQDYFSEEIKDKTLKSTVETKGEVKYGDTVNIDYKGYKYNSETKKYEDKPFDGGSTYDDSGKAKGTDLEIGSGSYIEGFEIGLIDHEIGETVSLYLTFPQNYSSTELAGKKVRFDVVINKVTIRYPYPEMTDAEIKKQSENEYSTVAEFKEKARETVIKNQIWGDFYDSCRVVKWPEQELKDYYYTSLESHKNNANYFYGSFDSYASAMGYSNGDALRAYVMQQARQQCKQDIMVLALIEDPLVKAFSLENNFDLEAKMKEIHKEAVDNGEFEGSYKKYLKTYDESAIRISAYTDLVMDYLMTKNTVVNNLGKNGFYGLPSNGVFYYENGERKTGWLQLDLDGTGVKDYYVDETLGAFQNIAKKMQFKNEGEEKYLNFGAFGLYKSTAGYDDAGNPVKEIVNDGNGYMCVFGSSYLTGLVNVDKTGQIEGEEQYLFSQDGYMYLGVQKLESEKLGLAAGALTPTESGSVNYEGKYYNFGTTGIFNFDLETKKNNKYGTATDNALAQGIYGDYCYENGEKKTGKHTDGDNNIYYFDPDNDGKMVKADLIEFDGALRYLDNAGKMLKGTEEKPLEIEHDGKNYTIDQNGVATEVPASTEGDN